MIHGEQKSEYFQSDIFFWYLKKMYTSRIHSNFLRLQTSAAVQ